MGTEDGLNQFDPLSRSVSHYTHDPLDPDSISSDFIKSLLVDRHGNLWIGTDNAGLNRYAKADLEGGTGLFRRYGHNSANGSSLSDDRITKLFEDNQGTIWIGTFNGLNALSGDQSGFVHYSHNLTNRQSIVHNTIVSIFQDRGGVLWIGTYDGLSRWNSATQFMGHHTVVSEAGGSLGSAIITSFAEKPTGEIWVGTFGSGLNLFDPATRQSDRFTGSTGGESGLQDDQVMALLVDAGGNLWVGTRSSGVSLLKKGENSFTHFRHNPHDVNSLSADTVTSILEDSSGKIWIGTYTGGLNLLDPDTGEISRFRHSSQSPRSISSDRIMALFEDSAGALWIGTHGGGLNRYDADHGTFERFQYDPQKTASISGNNVLAINEDQAGDLWIGTQGHGLNRWAREDIRNGVENFETFTESSGLASQYVYAMAVDPAGQVWLSSNKGLSKLDVETHSFKNFDTSHGLQGAEFTHGAALATSDGRLYFGGTDGFNRFDPATLVLNQNRPKVVITSVAILNQAVANLSTVIQQGLELSYEDYSVEFQFAGLDFAAPEKSRYRYRLEGLDEQWVEAGNRRYASYTNLAPGNYTFQVMAANYDDVWSDTSANVPIRVKVAPWLAWYAYIIYFSLFAAICWVVYRVQREKLRHADEVLKVNRQLAIEIRAGKRKEHALQREKERAQSYLEIADILIVVIDQKGLVRLINQKGCQTLGLEESRIIGTPWLPYVRDESKDNMRRWLSGDLNENRDAHYEISLVSVAGEIRRIMWRFAAFPDEAGEGELLLASGMDVTDIRELEKAVRVQEKLSAVGTMASGIAHDFNNILTAIIGYTMLAVEGLGDQENTKEFLHRVMEAGQRASDLVARLLSFTNLEDQELQPRDLGPVLLEATALLRGSLPATIEMSVDISRALKTVKSDSTQIHQLLMNLGTNAGKAMHGHVGVLEVLADTIYLTESAIPEDSALEAGEHLRLIVRDNGIGMTSDTLGNIFDPFFTTAGLGFGATEGTGLGLSVVHRIVTGHKGHISVESEPGEGTTITVMLPCCNEVISHREKLTQLSSSYSGRILIVDNEEWVADVCDRFLRLLGYSTTCFLQAHEALLEIKRHPEKFDLVISDQNMPHMLGSEFVGEIHKLDPGIPVILMSGNLSPVTTLDPLTSYLKKPFTIEELGRRVKKSLLDKVEPQLG